MEKDIRWKQRFENFQRAYKLLEQALNIKVPSQVERAGMIQFFEMTFELSWKMMKDYLESEGFVVNSPKEAIKQAFRADVIKDGQGWIDILAGRNLTVHTYGEKTAVSVESSIRETYYPLLKDLYLLFEEKIQR
ncbi:MAG: nucleotidyltransferase substrate binding protein [Anaerohalosphaeraceae bacterium]|nr:nucleotidyltransferase substrate binding protein [Anaerohalosphaeraceae bacterium]